MPIQTTGDAFSRPLVLISVGCIICYCVHCVRMVNFNSSPVLFRQLLLQQHTDAMGTGGTYRGGSPTAVQAWQTCPLWELSPSHPIGLYYCRLGDLLCYYFVFLCVLCFFVLFLFSFVASFSTLILLVGSFDL